MPINASGNGFSDGYGEFDFESRITGPEYGAADVENEFSLRPRTFEEYIGQDAVKENLSVFIQAARDRGDNLDHVLLHGPPGLGKTTLSCIIASALGVNLKVTSGPAIEKTGDLAALLTTLERNDVLFIDEIHRLPRAVEEVLYPAMEEFALDFMTGRVRPRVRYAYRVSPSRSSAPQRAPASFRRRCATGSVCFSDWSFIRRRSLQR